MKQHLSSHIYLYFAIFWSHCFHCHWRHWWVSQEVFLWAISWHDASCCIATIGASLLFLILKIGTHLPDTKNKSQLSQIINQLNQNSFYFIVTAPHASFPFFLVNLAAALLKIPLHIFFSASFLACSRFVSYNSIGAAAMTLTKNLQTTMNPLYFALLFALAGTVLVYLLLLLIFGTENNQRIGW